MLWENFVKALVVMGCIACISGMEARTRISRGKEETNKKEAGKKVPAGTPKTPAGTPKTPAPSTKKILVKETVIGEYIDEDQFCIPRPNARMPAFYRSKLDGAVCCKGNIIQATTVLPEVHGECAIGAHTEKNGIFDPAKLWCAYTCTLKKIKAIDPKGNIKPKAFFDHLARGLGEKTKAGVKAFMEKLGCYKEFQNKKFPCYTPLSFHKCYNDALEYFCNFGTDVSKAEKAKYNYAELVPGCQVDGKQVMPYCCHGKPLPWTIPDIIEAPRNVSKMKDCMLNMQNRVCSATCFMHSADVVDDSLELDVDAFEKNIIGIFPVVKPSIWMNYLGPTYVFFDETLEELSAPLPTAARVCLFHDKILNYHEDKIQQYCEMTPEEVKEIIQSSATERP